MFRRVSFGKPSHLGRPRSPHQLRAHKKRKNFHQPSTFVYNQLEKCPETVRDCISKLRSKAEIHDDGASHLARQIYFAARVVGQHIRKVGWYIEEYAITVLTIQAKGRAVQFRFLSGRDKLIINLLPEDALAA